MSSRKQQETTIPFESEPVNYPKPPLLDRSDEFLAKRMNFILWAGLIVAFVFACLLFEFNVSTGGDDSMYIENAWNFLKDGRLPVYKGTLYSVLLSGFIGIFGINIIVLKFFSMALILGSLYFYFKAFQQRLAPTVLIAAYAITCICSYYLYFASQTYSEALYLFLQALLLFLVLKLYGQPAGFALKKETGKAAVIALVAFLLFITRNIGIVAIAGIIIYLLLQKDWKRALTVALAFTALFMLFSLAKYLIWGTQESFGSSQFAEIAYKNLYNEQMGKEDVHGFIQRFLVNSNNFFSKHLYMLMGLRGEHVKVIPILATLSYAFLMTALFWAFQRKNRTVQLLSIHVFLLCTATFCALQTTWDQWRQLLVYYPYILILFAFVLYETLQQQKFFRYQWIFPALCALVFGATANATLSKLPESTDKLSHNLSGDPLYGITPDWKNYILASVWAAESLPKQYNIAVRKPNISFIYSQRNFYGIFRLDGSSYETIKNRQKPGYKSVILSMPDVALKKLYPDIAKYTVCVVAGSFEKTSDMPPAGTLVLYSMPADTLAMFETRFRSAHAHWIPNATGWLARQPHQESIFYYEPDVLLHTLQHNNVRYFILANLRLNPENKEIGIIDTLHKYFMVIECKYPGCMRLLHVEGNIEQAAVCQLYIPALWK